MNVIGYIAGILVMIILIPSSGILVASIVGAIVGGVVGFGLSALRSGGSQKSDTMKDNSELKNLVELRKSLARVKKIPVRPNELVELSAIIIRIENGDAHAHWMLGACLWRGKVCLMESFPRDRKSALFWFRKSAEMGLASSQYHLGVMYLGDAAALLGMQYSEEDALEKKFEEAIKWLSQAASQSDTFGAYAQDVLGEMYFLGIGVGQDHAKAFDLFSKSVANPDNTTLKFGIATRGWERLPELKAKGYA